MSSTPPTSSSSSSAASSSASSSWFDKAKSAAAAAAEATKKAAVYVADQSKATYESLKAPPTTVQCSGCPLQVEVPNNIFDWNCVNGHSNDRTAAVCQVCHSAKPKVVNPPQVTCSSCHTATIVPSSNAGKHLSEAATNTKKFAVSTTTAAKEQIKYLSSAPETFHCSHCNSLLAVPTGPWACQTCTAENAEDAIKCRQCGQKKSEQKAICGVCRQSTVIPTTNFFDGLKATTRDLAKSSSKVYLDVSGKTYTTCARCGTHIALTAPHAPGEKGGEVKPTVPSVVGGPAGGAEGQPHPEGGAAPTAAQQAELKELVCPSCKNKVEG